MLEVFQKNESEAFRASKRIFKDEVRVLGNSLNLIKDINYKHAFPGPGLGIRIVGNITSEE